MEDPCEGVKQILTAGITGTALTFNLNIGGWPSAPDKAILINQSGGRPPYPRLAINFPSVQVMVRGKASGYVEARDEMRKVCNILLGLGNITVTGGDIFRSCNQIGDVFNMGQDDNSRPMFSSNWWFIVIPSDLGNRVAIN